MKYLLIVVGGGAGSLARYLVASAISTRMGARFPWGTVIVNVTGCFLIGLIMTVLTERANLSPNWRFALVIGFLGGYTTFSSFGWETAKMLEAGEWAWATAYVGASVVAGLLLSVAGIRLANRF